MPHRRSKKGYGLSVRAKVLMLLAVIFLYVPVKFVFLHYEINAVDQQQAESAALLAELDNIHSFLDLIDGALVMLNEAEHDPAAEDDLHSRMRANIVAASNIYGTLPLAEPAGHEALDALQDRLSRPFTAENHKSGHASLARDLLAVEGLVEEKETSVVREAMDKGQSVHENIAAMRKTSVVSLLVGLFAALLGSWLIFNNLLRPLGTMRNALVAAGRDPENAEKYTVPVAGNSSDVSETLDAMNMLLLQVSSGLEDMIASENRMRARSRELRTILDNVLDGIITADSEGRILSFNASAEFIFGYKASEVIGENLAILMPEEYASKHDEYLRNYRGSGKAKIIGKGARSVTALRADGTTFPIELSVSEAHPGGRRIFIGAVRDVSEQAMAREQIERTSRMDAIGEMTGGLAHDFNNMLTVIAGNLEMIIDMADDDTPIASFARTAEKATARGADLTQRLLTFSRKQDLSPVFTELDEAIPDSAELIRRGLDDAILLEVVMQDDLWPVRIDRSQLDNALINLAFNARDAMDGTGTIRLQAENVVLDERYASELEGNVQPGEYVRLTVEDNGRGIDPEVLAHVYDPFFTTKNTGKGTGLGLSMVYGFIRQSGGAIFIDSVPGKGTTVNLLLPHCRAVGSVRPDETQDNNAAHAVNDVSGQGMVLVVEDDADLREHVCNVLEAAGFDVFRADCGPAALETIQDIDRLDLLLSDVVMPGGMNGEDVARFVQDKFPEVAVLYMSGYTREALMDDGRIREGITLVQKPFTRQKLIGMVNAALSGGADIPEDEWTENVSS